MRVNGRSAHGTVVAQAMKPHEPCQDAWPGVSGGTVARGLHLLSTATTQRQASRRGPRRPAPPPLPS
jgi:hypothetical protein